MASVILLFSPHLRFELIKTFFSSDENNMFHKSASYDAGLKGKIHITHSPTSHLPLLRVGLDDTHIIVMSNVSVDV